MSRGTPVPNRHNVQQNHANKRNKERTKRERKTNSNVCVYIYIHREREIRKRQNKKKVCIGESVWERETEREREREQAELTHANSLCRDVEKKRNMVWAQKPTNGHWVHFWKPEWFACCSFESAVHQNPAKTHTHTKALHSHNSSLARGRKMTANLLALTFRTPGQGSGRSAFYLANNRVSSIFVQATDFTLEDAICFVVVPESLILFDSRDSPESKSYAGLQGRTNFLNPTPQGGRPPPIGLNS